MRATAAQAHKILVVDDDADSRKLMTIVLTRRFRAQVITAESGRHAIRHLCHVRFDLVVSDLEMPNGTGLDVLAFLEARQPTRTRFILYTAANVPYDVHDRILAFQKPALQKALSGISKLGIFHEN